jgi:hypothetical protein
LRCRLFQVQIKITAELESRIDTELLPFPSALHGSKVVLVA